MSDDNIRIALVEKEVEQITKIFEKFDQTVDKIGDATQSIKQLLAVHDAQIKSHDTSINEVYKILDRHHNVVLAKVEELRKDMDKDSNDSTKTLSDKLDKVERSVQEMIESQDVRLKRLERWGWIAMGAAAVLGFFISHLNLPGIFQ